MTVKINETLNKNIRHIFGKKGEDWLLALPKQVETLAAHWHLSELSPVSNMTFNYVTYAVTNQHKPVVLKISCGEKSMQAEKEALAYFHGSGCITLLDAKDSSLALLLQRAMPGNTLKSFYKTQKAFVMDHYVKTMQQLHAIPLPDNQTYRHISDWLKAIDHLKPDDPCPHALLKKAISLKNNLLSSMTEQRFLHGDLHHDNILQAGDEWFAIDPKGVVGEPAFEAAAFDFMYIDELAGDENIKKIMENRINLLAQKADLSAKRLKEWVFVRLMLMVAWLIEDGGDFHSAMELAQKII